MVGPFISYLRVSTDRQGVAGLGIEAQRTAVQNYVTGAGGTLVTEHVEVETGRASKRPVLHRALAECRRHQGTLVIARLDRLARSVSFISSLIDGKVDFVAVDNPAANKPMLQMLAVFGEYERDQIASRTKAALAAAKSRGVVLGAQGRILAAKNRADADQFAEQMRQSVRLAMSAGCDTLGQLAGHLNGMGLRTREGGVWTPQSAHRLLQRLNMRTSAMALRTKG